MNIRLIHLKRIGKRKKEELQDEQGRNGNVAEGNRTGDDRPGQAETGGRIQENIETDRIIKKDGERIAENLMTLRQIANLTGKIYKDVYNWAKNNGVKPFEKRRIENCKKPVFHFDPQPFFERFGKKENSEKPPYEKPTIEPATPEESREALNQFYEETAKEEYPQVAPPLPTLTPELICAFKDVCGANGAMNILRYNYGLNWLGEE